MRFTLPILLGAIFIASFCPKAPVDTVAPVLSSARLYYDDAAAFPDSTLEVVRDVTTWRDVWARATSMQPTPPARPAIDFSREMVILAAAGKMTPGDQIKVDSAGIRDDVFKIFVRTIVGCQRFPTDAYPFEIVSVPAADEPVDWVQSREEGASCR
ncbi:MAG: hypothetical protein JSV86_13460 [Gemmatimonadota bacterium]|nr:MAG: hypothetical protein JSV86_13460 [Gemmatimonadota bacterium]